MKRISFILLLLFLFSVVQGQAIEKQNTIFYQKLVERKTVNYKELIVPTVLVGYGIVALQSPKVKKFDYKIQNKLYAQPHKKISIDDYLALSPTLAVYGFNALDVEGKYRFCDRTIIITTAGLLMSSVVLTSKHFTRVKRPDGSAFTSFPSGHTAVAFMGAEFLYQEYKNVSPWYGVVGYTVATTTAFFRMYNNRHWFSDVITGAGLGILSTKAAYWLYPHIKSTFFKQEKRTDTLIFPYYDGQNYGVSLSMNF